MLEVCLCSIIIFIDELCQTEVVEATIVVRIKFASLVIDFHFLCVVVSKSCEVKDFVNAQLLSIFSIKINNFFIALTNYIDRSLHARIAKLWKDLISKLIEHHRKVANFAFTIFRIVIHRKNADNQFFILNIALFNKFTESVPIFRSERRSQFAEFSDFVFLKLTFYKSSCILFTFLSQSSVEVKLTFRRSV